MPAAILLPSEVTNDFQLEARDRGLDAETYTRFAMDAVAEAFAASPPEDEHELLLMMSRLENELPKAWRNTDDTTLQVYALALIAVWFFTKPERWHRLTAAVSPVARELSYQSVHAPTIRELKAMPREQREAIMRAQAADAAPLYAADLALPPAERELTAFSVLDDYDAVLEPERYLANHA